jgi:hypothetical protein
MDFNKLTQIINDRRKAGVVHIKMVTHNDGIQNALSIVSSLVSSLGFKIDKAIWNEVDSAFAEAHLTSILNKDLAYEVEIMPKEEANRLAIEFLKNFSGDKKIFTNLRPSPETHVWNPVTKATFDTGIIVVDSLKVGILWVEDED